MFILILILLVGISFSPFLFIDHKVFLPWHVQGMWAQVLIMTAFSWSFFENPKYIPKRNIPLGLLHLWVGGSTAIICTKSQMAGVYNYWTLFPYFNFLCLMVLYTLITRYLSKQEIRTILRCLRYVVIATLGMCVLQYVGLSQFFRLFVKDHGQVHYNLVTGFIGNGTHLSGLLAMCIPLFLWKNTREDKLAILLTLLVLCVSGSTIRDPSISGFIISIALIIYMAKRRFAWSVLLLGSGILAGMYVYKHNPSFFSVSGRLDLWGAYLPILKEKFILGSGLGTVKVLSTTSQFPKAHHLHLEYYQYLVELGLIGLILIGNVIIEFIKKKPQGQTDKVLKAIVFGFLLSCLFNFPSHLWLPSIIAIFAYSSLLTQELTHAIFTQRNKGFSIKLDSTE